MGLTNVVAANHAKVERGFEELSNIIRDHRAEGERDRELIRKQNDAMNTMMQEAIIAAIQKGEAEAKAVADRSREALSAEKQGMLVEITNTVEKFADMAFKQIQGNHQHIADNYLSPRHTLSPLRRRSWSMLAMARERTCPPWVTCSSTSLLCLR